MSAGLALVLQMGQESLGRLSHSLMHLLWKVCEQGRMDSQCPSQQMMHSVLSCVLNRFLADSMSFILLYSSYLLAPSSSLLYYSHFLRQKTQQKIEIRQTLTLEITTMAQAGKEFSVSVPELFLQIASSSSGRSQQKKKSPSIRNSASLQQSTFWKNVRVSPSNWQIYPSRATHWLF